MLIEPWIPNNAEMADNPTNPDRRTESSKESHTPPLAAEIAKHVVAALRPQPEASSSKGKRNSMAMPTTLIFRFFTPRV